MFEAIRRERRDDPDVSIRELAARHGVHRRTVRQALASAEPPPRKVPVRTAPVLDPVKPLIDAMLRQDLDAPRKQRHTALRVRERLLDEHQLVTARAGRARRCSYVVKRLVGGLVAPSAW
ncbi:MAG: hypothetical protein IPL41_06400 [Micropruina sp.]|nr:hypothetical protein [Micropruina sp.]